MSAPNLQRRMFLAMAAVLIVSLIVSFIIGLGILGRAKSLAEQRALILELSDFFSALKGAETGQRGFLLTGDDSYLAPYDSALKTAKEELASLHNLAEQKKLDAGAMAEVERLTGKKLAELARTIEIRRTQGAESAIAAVRTDVGQHLMEELSQQISQMLAAEEARARKLEREVRKGTWQRNAVFGGVALLNLLFFALCYRRIREETERTAQAAQETTRQKDLLDVTLRSIGDGVIITDMEGRITFLNSVAAQLTGWGETEAVGELCSKVFHIINEDSRQSVESPVDKVLRLGTIVGLANHTLLVRRDGTEVSIDDSGAPVRERNGNVVGVVLVFRDFTEYKAAERELIAANQARDRFLATLSHELRTPLTPVLLSASALAQDTTLTPTVREEIRGIARNVELEARLIDDLLDLTAISKGKVRLRTTVLDTRALVQEVVDIVASDAKANHLQLVMRAEATERYVSGDAVRLQQALWNLVKNASKFTPAGGTITIRTWNSAPGTIDFAVEDTGVGIEAKDIDQIFKPFEQVESDLSARYGGLGLGLTIAKAIVDLHHGSLEATSAGRDQGSQFHIQLKTVEPQVKALPKNGAQPATNGHMRILLVDDHAQTLEVLSRLLKRDGHDVTTADCIAAARACWQASTFDLLISDLGLPDGSGTELLKSLRQEEPIRAIALSGYGMEDDRQSTEAAGFSQHLVKPVDIEQLREAIIQMRSAAGSGA